MGINNFTGSINGQEKAAADVRVMLRGGLGNQLFGWATGFCLASKLGGSLVLDDTRIGWGDYAKLDPRAFELRAIQTPSAHSHLRVDLLATALKKKLVKTHSPKCNVFRENSFRYNEEVSSIKGSVCLEGYFQSWRYFDDCRGEIIRRVRQGFSPSSFAEKHLSDFSGQSWIAIHIRRGDYLRIDSMARIGSAYYSNAIKKLTPSNSSLKIVTFSESLDDSVALVPGADLHLDSAKLEKAWDVLQMMSSADALIGANSSLSWWSAYVSYRNGRRNIFPSRWFNDDVILTQDLLMPDWGVVES